MIKTFEEACGKLNLDASKLPDVSTVPEKYAKAIIGHFKIMVIAEALNEGWQPNWNDHNEWKYYPWFKVLADKNKPSGFGLSVHVYDGTYSGTAVGSRLCYKSSELALYAGEQFKEIYEDCYLMK